MSNPTIEVRTTKNNRKRVIIPGTSVSLGYSDYVAIAEQFADAAPEFAAWALEASEQCTLPKAVERERKAASAEPDAALVAEVSALKEMLLSAQQQIAAMTAPVAPAPVAEPAPEPAKPAKAKSNAAERLAALKARVAANQAG